MYIDPPYPGNKVNYAHNMRSWDDHERLASRLLQTNCKWVLSSYDTPQVHALFPDCYFTPIQSYSGMNTEKNSSERVVNKEVLITNYKPLKIQAESPTHNQNILEV
jgi:DNA adenine methylase